MVKSVKTPSPDECYACAIANEFGDLQVSAGSLSDVVDNLREGSIGPGEKYPDTAFSTAEPKFHMKPQRMHVFLALLSSRLYYYNSKMMNILLVSMALSVFVAAPSEERYSKQKLYCK